MGKIFVGFGLVFLTGGAYAIGDGWPYLVLERGFTQVILGAISATLGVLLLAIAVVFAAIQRLENTLEDHLAAVHSQPATAAAVDGGLYHAPVPSEPRPAFEPHVQPPISTGTAAAAGAVAIGAGLAGLAASKPDDERQADEEAAEADQQTDLFEPAVSVAAMPEEVEDRVVALDHSEWIDPLEADLTADPEPLDDTVDADAASSEERAVEAEAEDDAGVDAAEPAGQDEPAVLRTRDSEAGPLMPEPPVSVMPEPVTDAPRSPETEPWWPRIEPRDHQQDASPVLEPPASEARDEFGDLRAELSHALRAPLPEPASDEAALSADEAQDRSIVRPWPPVTQPVAPEVLAVAEDAGGRDAEEAPETPPMDPADEWDALTDVQENEVPENPVPAETAPEEAEAEGAEPIEDGPGPADDKPSAPVASQDGIVGAYQVGEAHFTMYADGSIQARTPDGDYVFASMDELKAYLAREKSKLEPGAA